jgi:hypothetical protein
MPTVDTDNIKCSYIIKIHTRHEGSLNPVSLNAISLPITVSRSIQSGVITPQSQSES